MFIIFSLGYKMDIKPKEEVKNMQDKKIKCNECGYEFIFSVKDQEFFKEMNFSEPKKCKKCKKNKNQR